MLKKKKNYQKFEDMPLKKKLKKRLSPEAKAARKERQISLKKEEIIREVNYGKFNEERYRRFWRDIMLNVKMPILREEIEVVWHNFERSCDTKNHRASLIIDAIEKAREQYETNFLTHTESIDHFLQIYGERLREQENHYRNHLEELVKVDKENRENIEEEENDDEINLRSIIFITNENNEELLSEIRSRTIAKVDLLTESNKTSRRMAAAILESQMADRWNELCQVLDDYENSTKQRRKSYEAIKLKDDHERNIMERQISTTRKLNEIIRRLREKIQRFQKNADERISEIRTEHDYFHDAYRVSKLKFLSDEKGDKARIIFLTKEFHSSKERLEKLVKKAQNILILMHECNKYETEDEKIIQPTCSDDNYLNKDEILKDDLRIMEINFWRRVGAARLITMELELEKKKLLQESLSLRESLCKYLEDPDNVR